MRVSSPEGNSSVPLLQPPLHNHSDASTKTSFGEEDSSLIKWRAIVFFKGGEIAKQQTFKFHPIEKERSELVSKLSVFDIKDTNHDDWLMLMIFATKIPTTIWTWYSSFYSYCILNGVSCFLSIISPYVHSKNIKWGKNIVKIY